VFGLLDDVMAEDSSALQKKTQFNPDLEDLFHTLVFSPDTRSAIVSQLDKCSEPGFTEYLNISMENSDDEKEAQGLQELIDSIRQVQDQVATTQEQQQILEEQQAKEEAEAKEEEDDSPKAKLMSNSDVLKQANSIDQAVMTAAMNDDEKPSDFISDCREVVNLSRGFNNQGQMRVGGR
jgi:hypothetical protein